MSTTYSFQEQFSHDVRLYPPDTYRELVAPDAHNLHVLGRTKDNQELLMLGSDHYTQPEHSVYHYARPLLEKWLENTSRHLRTDRPGIFYGPSGILVLEGPLSAYGYGATFDDTIRYHFSEIGLKSALADLYSIEIISGEKPHHGVFADVIKRIPPNEAWLYLRLREAPVWFRKGEEKRPSFEDYMEEVLANYKRDLGRLALLNPLPELDFSLSGFLHDYKQQFGQDFDPHSKEQNDFHLRLTSAQLEDAAFAAQPVARVAPEVMKERDTYYAQLILGFLARRRPVASWIGKHHTLAIAASFDTWGEPTALPPEYTQLLRQVGPHHIIDLPDETPSPPPARRTWHEDFALLAFEQPKSLPPLLPDNISKREIDYIRSSVCRSKLLYDSGSPFIDFICKFHEPWYAGISSQMNNLIDTYLASCPRALQPPYPNLDLPPTGLENWCACGKSNHGHPPSAIIPYFPTIARFRNLGREPIDPTERRAFNITKVSFDRLSSAFQPSNTHGLHRFQARVIQLFQKLTPGFKSSEVAWCFDKAAIQLATVRKHVDLDIQKLQLTADEALLYCLDYLEVVYGAYHFEKIKIHLRDARSKLY